MLYTLVLSLAVTVKAAGETVFPEAAVVIFTEVAPVELKTIFCEL